MNLIQIITLYNGGNLPADPTVLTSCLEVLKHADALAYDTWRTTTNPRTARMLESEQINYSNILRYIQGMLKAGTISGAPQRETSALRRHRYNAFHYSTIAQ